MAVSLSSHFAISKSTQKHHVLDFSYRFQIHFPTLTCNFTLRRLTSRRDSVTCMCKEDMLFEKGSYVEAPAFPTVFDINQIQEILPHRYPFLFVDRVIECNPGVSAVGIRHLTNNESFFQGHFPGNPIMPGVLILEAMVQVGGIISLQTNSGLRRDKVIFIGAKNIKFRKQVTVGDTLVMKVTLLSVRPFNGYLHRFEGKAYVGDDLVCEAEMMLHAELINKDHKSDVLKKMELLGRN